MLKYQMPLTPNETDFDENGAVLPSSILHFFQDIAKTHAEVAGFGFGNMIAQNLIWVVTKLKYKIYRPITKDGDYTIVTYPKPKKSITYSRDYYIYDSADHLVAAGMSQWCVINFKTRKIERWAMDYEGEFYDKEPFDEGFERIRIPELIKRDSYKIVETDLDANQHTNNCRYADMVAMAVSGGDAKQLQIQFSKETRLGDEIILFSGKNENGDIVVGKLADDSVIFTASIQ